MTCTPRSRDNEVLSYSGDNEHFNKNTGDRNVDSTQTEGYDAKTESYHLGKDSVLRPNMLTKETITDNGEEIRRREWKSLARKCDWVLFFIFAAIHLFMIMLLFVALPSIYA